MNKTKPTTTKKGKLPLVKEDIKEETIVAVETKALTLEERISARLKTNRNSAKNQQARFKESLKKAFRRG